MNIGLYGKNVMRSRQRALRRQYLADVRAGLRKGPETLKHEAGKKHKVKMCSICVIAARAKANDIPFIW